MADDFKLQQYPATVSADGETLTLNEAVGSLDSAFVFMNANRYTGTGTAAANHEVDDLSVQGRLTGLSTVTFDRPASTPGRDIDVELTVVEYVGAPGGPNEFIVRSRNEVDMTSTLSNTATLDNTPTDIDRCVPIINGNMSADTTNSATDLAMLAFLSGTNTLNVEGSVNGSTAKSIHVTTVEFTGSNWSVGHGRANSFASDSGSISLVEEADGLPGGTSFDVSDWATATIIGWGQSGAGGNDLAVNWMPIFERGSATTQVDYTFNSSHNTLTSDLMVHVIRNADLSVTVYSSTAGTAPITETVDITSAGLTDLAQSLAVLTALTNTGTAYPRGWRVAEFDSLTQVSHRTSFAGGQWGWALWVVDFSALQSAAGDDVAIGTGAETDTASPITADLAAVNVGTGQPTETDTARPVNPDPAATSQQIGQADSAESANPITGSSGPAAGQLDQAAETEDARPITPSVAAATVIIGQAVEVDTARPVTADAAAVQQQLSQATETGTARPVNPQVAASAETIGQAATTNTANPITPEAAAADTQIGTATETDTAAPITPIADGAALINRAIDTHTAGGITPTAAAADQGIGQAAETDTTQPIGADAGATRSIGQATSTETGRNITADPEAGLVPILPAAETDTARPITPGSVAAVILLLQAAEIDTALELLPTPGPMVALIGSAEETDIALPILAVPEGIVVAVLLSSAAQPALRFVSTAGSVDFRSATKVVP